MEHCQRSAISPRDLPRVIESSRKDTVPSECDVLTRGILLGLTGLQFVLLGANDAVQPLPTTSQHVPIDEYKKNLGNIINHDLVRAHKPKIIIVVPPPVDEIKLTRLDLADGHQTSQRTSAITAAYAEKVREVARENPGVELIDLWQAIHDKALAMTPGSSQEGGALLGTHENGNQGGLDSLLHDGLHMSGEAYKVLFDLVVPHIGAAELDSADRESFVLPDWKVLNPWKA